MTSERVEAAAQAIAVRHGRGVGHWGAYRDEYLADAEAALAAADAVDDRHAALVARVQALAEWVCDEHVNEGVVL